MQTYKQYRPTGFDPSGLGLSDRQDWLVLPCGRNRDSDCLAESNFASALASLGGESEMVEVHRFGHWACGWFEIILIKPGTDAATEAERIEAALSDYPILDDSDFSEREHEAAQQAWRDCYTDAQRLEYIAEHRSQFEFTSLSDMMGCVRGKHFCGYAGELLAR